MGLHDVNSMFSSQITALSLLLNYSYLISNVF